MTSRREWFCSWELAEMALPGLPRTHRHLLARMDRERWLRPEWKGLYWRPHPGIPGNCVPQLHIDILPPKARGALFDRAAN